MRYIFAFLALFLLAFACINKENSSSSTSTSSQGVQDSLFRMESIPASNFRLAKRTGKRGELQEEGVTDAKGLKNGIWVTYQGEGGYPAKIASYVNGLYNGPYFEFDGFGQMAVRASYRNNKLHGLLVKFNSGDLVQESEYKDGVLDGLYKEYNRSGSVQKEIGYKNGQLDGPLRYYDEAGKITIEYRYKNGKQQ